MIFSKAGRNELRSLQYLKVSEAEGNSLTLFRKPVPLNYVVQILQQEFPLQNDCHATVQK